MRLIDLSQPVRDGMPVYPGDPQVSIGPALSIAADGVAVARMALGTHTGTHLDAPAHFVPGGRTVEQIPLDLLDGPAVILRVPRADAAQRIDAAAVEGGVPEELPRIVCVQTGWDRHFGEPGMPHHPYLSLNLAQLLWERGARVLGVDTLSPDPTELPGQLGDAVPGQSGAGSPVHEFWLGGDGVIVENLRGLDQLDGLVELSLLPLAIEAGDGSPIRAVARVRSGGAGQ